MCAGCASAVRHVTTALFYTDYGLRQGSSGLLPAIRTSYVQGVA